MTEAVAATTRFGRFRRMIHPSQEGARVTMFELFFDLVFVFAFTQVTRLIAETHSAVGILQALIVLGLLWWSWIAYGWLANQTRADRGIIRVGMIVATIGIFVIALAIPEAYHDLPGGLNAPVVLVVCYLGIRVAHGVLYYLAAGDDPALQRQVLVTVPAALVPAAILLFAGVAVGDPGQTWFWLAALLVDAGIVYATSRIGWRIHSAAHWAERHSLIVILALGESVVSIGGGVARLPLDVSILVGSALAVLLTFGLWWAYFERMASTAEKVLAHHEGQKRTSLARDAVHLPSLSAGRGHHHRGVGHGARDGARRRARGPRRAGRAHARGRRRGVPVEHLLLLVARLRGAFVAAYWRRRGSSSLSRRCSRSCRAWRHSESPSPRSLW